jgi:hypothetical protein
MVQSMTPTYRAAVYWWPGSGQDLPGACFGIAGLQNKAGSKMEGSWHRNVGKGVAGSDSPGAADDLHCRLSTCPFHLSDPPQRQPHFFAVTPYPTKSQLPHVLLALLPRRLLHAFIVIVARILRLQNPLLPATQRWAQSNLCQSEPRRHLKYQSRPRRPPPESRSIYVSVKCQDLGCIDTFDHVIDHVT